MRPLPADTCTHIESQSGSLPGPIAFAKAEVSRNELIKFTNLGPGRTFTRDVYRLFPIDRKSVDVDKEFDVFLIRRNINLWPIGEQRTGPRLSTDASLHQVTAPGAIPTAGAAGGERRSLEEIAATASLGGRRSVSATRGEALRGADYPAHLPPRPFSRASDVNMPVKRHYDGPGASHYSPTSQRRRPPGRDLDRVPVNVGESSRQPVATTINFPNEFYVPIPPSPATTIDQRFAIPAPPPGKFSTRSRRPSSLASVAPSAHGAPGMDVTTPPTLLKFEDDPETIGEDTAVANTAGEAMLPPLPPNQQLKQEQDDAVNIPPRRAAVNTSVLSSRLKELLDKPPISGTTFSHDIKRREDSLAQREAIVKLRENAIAEHDARVKAHREDTVTKLEEYFSNTEDVIKLRLDDTVEPLEIVSRDREARAERRDEELRRRETAAQQREDQLEERESEVQRRETSVEIRELQVMAREIQVTAREAKAQKAAAPATVYRPEAQGEKLTQQQRGGDAKIISTMKEESTEDDEAVQLFKQDKEGLVKEQNQLELDKARFAMQIQNWADRMGEMRDEMLGHLPEQ